MLINLISNALKFTQRGIIDVSFSFDEGTMILYGRVRDTGLGIKKENQDKLFKLFGKLDTGHRNINKTGIGLGLSICKRIIEACGGEIKLDKEYEDGASFSFFIKCPE